MAQFFADAFLSARLTLVDVAAEMLDVARARFAGRAGVDYVVADYATALPPGQFDLVVSALSIHHLEDDDKQALFASVRDALAPSGTFINADQVLGSTAATATRNRAGWLAAARSAGATLDEIARAEERMKHDRLATLDDQLRWLREAGFRDVDCTFKWGMFAVYSGTT